MPEQEMSFRVSITVQGDLARAFAEEFARRVRVDPSTTKSDVARDLMVSGLKACGYEVEDTVQWGGYRQRQDEDLGELAAVATS